MTTGYAKKTQVDLISKWAQATYQLHTGPPQDEKQVDDDGLR